ncbi:MAG TPA: hypothetical protein VGI48_01135 [Caldimonas sp.]|jgi:hypothetical protein
MAALCRRRIAVVAAVIAAGGWVSNPGVAYAQATVTGTSCQSVEHRQFDFWVGHWEVYVPSGKKAGENRIQVIADGCALLEEWSGGGGVTGKSLNIYDTGDRHWHQTWVDNSGTLLMLTGGFAERSMVMAMTGPSPIDPAKTVQQRITWTPAADGSVRQLWESSVDAGRTWTVLFDGRYVRVP